MAHWSTLEIAGWYLCFTSCRLAPAVSPETSTRQIYPGCLLCLLCHFVIKLCSASFVRCSRSGSLSFVLSLHIYSGMLVVISAFFFVRISQPALAAPTNPPNSTSSTVGFVPESGGRDTLSLLFSCLLTLVLCVYSAVHLNIPTRGEPAWKTRYRELKWCIIGVFGPELILYAAWRQWSSARELRHQLNGLSFPDDSRDNLSLSMKEGTVMEVRFFCYSTDYLLT